METRFYVYRHGYNSANQSCVGGGPETICVAEVMADSEEHACELAHRRVTVYSNQYLYAKQAESVDAAEAKIDKKVKVFRF